jgi:RHS repeat-associated protein
MRLSSAAFAVIFILAGFPQDVSASVAETREVKWSTSGEPDLLAKATALGTPAAIYEFVRNEFEFAPYDGARSNSTNTFLSRRGNDVDIASVLIAMLRSQGIRARYAEAVISFSEADVLNWLEVTNAAAAVRYLQQAGYSNVGSGAGRIAFRHTWVKALVPLDQYRGAGPAAQHDCIAQPAACVWVDLDPSFKLHRFRNPAELVDVSTAVQFDYDAYYKAELESFVPADGIDRKEKGPLEVYEDQILKYLHTTPAHAGKTLEDVVYEGVVIPEQHGIVPTSPPFRVDPATVGVWDSVVLHDTASGVPKWTKTVKLKFTFPDYEPLRFVELESSEIPLVDLSIENLTFSYESNDYDTASVPKALVTRLGGTVHQSFFNLINRNFTLVDGSTGSIPPGPALPDVGTPFDVKVTMSGAGTSTITADYPDLTLGGQYLVATGGAHSNWSQVHRSADRLLEAIEDHPVVANGSGELFLDLNENGAVNPGEPRLLETGHIAVQLTGGVLAMAKDLYYARIREAIERVAALQRSKMPASGFLGVVSSVHDVRSIDGTAFQVTPSGLLVDMKALTVSQAFRIDNNQDNGPIFRLGGHIISSLEHEIWQELTGFEAISTMRGIQRTLRDGATLQVLNGSQTAQEIADLIAGWGFQQTMPSGGSGFGSQTLSLYGYSLWLPHANNGVKTLSILRETITPSTTVLQRRGWDLKLNTSGSKLETFFRWFPDTQADLAPHPDTDPLQNAPVNIMRDLFGLRPPYGGCPNASTVGQLESALQPCFTTMMARPELKEYKDYAEFFHDFVPGDHLFRHFVPEEHIKAFSLAPIRTEVLLGADPNGDGTPDANVDVEYVIPTLLADGELIDFAVWIKRYMDAAGDEFSSSYVINRAGGGYVSGASPIDIYDPGTWGEHFNSELFTDLSLTSSINNSIFTPSTIDPISTVTGNVYHDEQDLEIRGRGDLPFLFTRTYNSGPSQASDVPTPMGPKWTHSYNMRLIARDHGQTPHEDLPENSDNQVSSIVYVDERGGEVIFGLSGSGPISDRFALNPRGNHDLLDLTGGSTVYKLKFRNGSEYHFGNANLATKNTVARLTKIVDPYGNELNLTYNASGELQSVTDNLALAGRTGLSMTYYSSGQLKRIDDWAGRAWNYSYDAAGNLSSFTDPLGAVTKYYYAAGTHLLTRVEKPESRDFNSLGDVVTEFSYYTNSRGFGNVNSFGHGEQVDYDLFRKRTRITDPRGFITSHYYDENGELTKTTHADGGVTQFKHNTSGNRWSKTDPLGFTTLYSYCSSKAFTGCLPSHGGNVTAEKDPEGGTTEYSYSSDLFDQPTSIKDKNGGTRTFSYYLSDNPATGAKRGKLWMARVTALGSHTNVLLEENKYNTNGTIKEKVEYIEPGNFTRKRITTYTYAANGLQLTDRVATGTDGTTRAESFTYDSLGRLKTATLKRRTSLANATLLNLTTTYDYDAMDRVIRVTDPTGTKTEMDYDKNGNPVEARRIGLDPATNVLQPARVLERRSYDRADRVIEIRDADDHSTTFTYDEAGNQTSVTDPTGVTRYLTYDSHNRVVAIADENGHRSETRYDLNGRVIAEIDANGNATTYTYDRAGRRLSETTALGQITSYRYDPNGNPVGVRNANANATPFNFNLVNQNFDSVTRTYDQLGRVTKTTDALDHDTIQEYDLLGNLTLVRDAELQETRFVYDDLGRVKEIIDPRIETPTDKRKTFVYDEADNPLQLTDRNGNVVRTTYDKLNRPVQKEYVGSSEVETLAYDAFGNLERLTNGELTYTYDYDRMNRLVSRVDDRFDRSFLFEYDVAGRLVRKTDYQGDDTRYLYDGTGRLISEQGRDYVEAAYHYDDAGRLLSRILSNGARTDYTYDAADRLLSITNRSATGTTAHSATYGYDAAGNITSTGGTGFQYDPLNRLTLADYTTNANDREYTYDAVGNRETERVGQTWYDYVYETGNRLKEIRQVSDNALFNSFDYDFNGNIVTKRDGAGVPVWTLTFDARNRVATATGTGFSNAFGYDQVGHRVRRDDAGGSHLFHLEGEHLEAVYKPDGTLRAKYLRGALIDEVVSGYTYNASGAASNFTFHHDQVTSVVALTDPAGAVAESTTYGPFGEALTSSPTTTNALRFTGRERDPGTNLYYYRARYYDPTIGRFIQEDPIGFSGGINRYVYAGNNPIGANDPTGLIEQHTDLSGLPRIGRELADLLHVEFSLGGQASFSARLGTVIKVGAGVDFGTQRAAWQNTGATGSYTEGLSAEIGAFHGNRFGIGVKGVMRTTLDQLPRAGDNMGYLLDRWGRDEAYLTGQFGPKVGKIGTRASTDSTDFMIGGGAALLLGIEANLNVSEVYDAVHQSYQYFSSSGSAGSGDTASSLGGGSVLYPGSPNLDLRGAAYLK